MKRSSIAMLIFVLVFLPLSLYIGSGYGGRSYYITAVCILAGAFVTLIWAYRGKGIEKSLIIIIFIMTFLSVLMRVFVPIPNFKPVYAFIMLSGAGLGMQSGFLVGALTALVSNFFYGQGAYLPWQMLAFGMGGMLAGIAFRKGRLPRKPVSLALYGFVTVMVFIGPMLDCSQLVFLSRGADALKLLHSGLSVNFNQALCTLLTMLILGGPIIDKLERYKKKFDLREEDDGL